MRKVIALIIAILGLGIISNNGEAISFTYEADKLPWDDGWSIGHYTSYKDHASLETDDGRSVLHIIDDSTAGGSALWVYKTWDVVPSGWYNTATFRLKSVSSSGRAGINIGISMVDENGNQHYQFYGVLPNGILDFPSEKVFYSFDTTSDYNDYTIKLYQGMSELWINGELILSHTASSGLYNGVNGTQFGAGSSQQTGECYWDYVQGTQAPIPEPSTIFLVGSGIMGLLALCLRARKKSGHSNSHKR